MNEPAMNDSIWVTGYLPDGFKVSLTLLLTAERDVQFWMNYVRSQGILPREPGLNAGEQSEEIGWILRTLHSSDGKETPRLFLYPTKEVFRHKWTSIWLNTEQQIADFEAATGLKFDQLPEFPGGAFKRGDNPRNDKQYLIPLPRPLRVIWAINPKYDKTIKGPQSAEERKFVRWENQPVASPSPAASEPAAQTETKSAAPKVDRAALLELVSPFYDHPNHARASLNKLLDHTDSEYQEWWIPADAPTIAAAYGVLLYKAANTESVAMNREQVLAALGVTRFSEWNKQHVTDADALQAAWAKLQAEAVGDF